MEVFSEHARTRCAQRHIPQEDIDAVMRMGRKIHRTGVTFYFLGRRDIPRDMRTKDKVAKLEGTTLLVSSDGTIITAYRNRDGLSKIRKKAKYRLVS